MSEDNGTEIPIPPMPKLPEPDEIFPVIRSLESPRTGKVIRGFGIAFVIGGIGLAALQFGIGRWWNGLTALFIIGMGSFITYLGRMSILRANETRESRNALRADVAEKNAALEAMDRAIRSKFN